MTAMPAEKWPDLDPETEEKIRLDLLILTVAYYRELVGEYPMTMVYRHLLEEAQGELTEAEKRHHLHATI
ncbi:MAG TPA: hypothetical protein VLJ37_08145 [bacterium]|nr:hypothetical protein [bacterium]